MGLFLVAGDVAHGLYFLAIFRSGTVTILEAYRGLIASNFTPTEDVWFHWYSAEEGERSSHLSMFSH